MKFSWSSARPSGVTSPARLSLQRRAALVLVGGPTGPELHLSPSPTRIRLSGTIPA